ncbi:B2 protein-like [Zophobas morio]|uniref:B2 protein-like n=1 Tax=Zophobas morio TaxID=2755281 RepID=UPI003083434D
MKLLVCCFLLITSTLAILDPSRQAKLDQLSDECQSESPVSAETLNKLRQTEQFEEIPALQKHIFCVLKKTGIVSESGDINIDVVKTKLKKVNASDETVNTVEQQCVVKKDTPVVTGFELMKCVYSKQSNFSPAD